MIISIFHIEIIVCFTEKKRKKTPDGNKRANSFQIKSHTKGKKQKKTDKPWRVSLLVIIGLP